jgi:hypothetical protein
MLVHGSNGTAPARSTAAVRRPSSGNFTVPQQEPPAATRPGLALRAVGGVDALMALQGVEEPAERRRRAVKRGRQALDVLEEIRLGLLSNTLDPSMLFKLKSAAASLKEASGNSALDNVLAEIELRVEVELAKAGIR